MIFATLRLVSILFFRCLGRLFFFVFKKRRNIAITNVKKCYKFISSERTKKNLSTVSPSRIVKRSFAGLGQNLSDFLLLKYYTSKNIDKYINIKNKNFLFNYLDKPRGIIILSAHFGSWELAAHYFGLKGFKSMIVYTKFKKPDWLDDYVKRRRELSGNKLVLKDRSFLSLYKHLKNGGISILLTDQHAAAPEGDKINFLGQNAWSHTTFAKLAIKTNSVIIPAFMFTRGYFKYVIKLMEPIDPLNSSIIDFKKVSRLSNNAIENAIIEDPGQWMWQHRRFKQN